MKKTYPGTTKLISGILLLLLTFFTGRSLHAQCTPLTISTLPVGGLVCSGSGITLTASGLNTYTWTGGITNGVGFTLNANTTYTVTGTISSGTCAGTYSRVVNVSVSTPPSNQAVSASPSSILCGANVTVAIASSQTSAAYYLRNDANNSVFTGPVSGTGSGLNIIAANIITPTTFNVNAVNLSRSMFFDGVNDQAIISNTMSTAGDFSWEAWFKCSADGSIMSLSPASGNWATGGKSLFIRSGKLSFDCNGIAYIETPAYVAALTDGKWHHAALTNKADYSGVLDRTTLYVDGQIVLVKKDWDITSSQGTGMTNKIGYTSPDFPTTPAFNGSLDDVKFWGTERTQFEVISDMSSCPPAATAGLDAFYTFEDGTSTLLSDNATGYRPGVLTNMSPSPVTPADGREACSSCSAQMTNKPAVTISALALQSVAALTPSFCASGTTSITTAGSETGVNYYMATSANTTITGPLAGTGSALSFITGTVNSTRDYSVTARRNSGALNFDGVDDIVEVNQTAALAQFSSTPMTMEAWVYPTNIATIKSVIRKEGSYNLYLNNGRIYFEMYRNTGGGTNYTITLGQTILPVNQWSHIAAVWYGGIYADIFLNGNQEIIGGGSSTNNNVSDLAIGRAIVANQTFAGKLDEIRIWNTSRTAAQIKNNMRTCLTGSEPGLLLYYKLNDQGTAIIDAAGGDNNGVLLNSNQATVWDSGVDNCGCSLQMTDTPTITVYAVPTLSVNSATICSGNSVVIAPTGAGTGGTYSVTGGAFTVSPSSSTNYSVTGTNSVGCAASNTAVSSVSVNTTPTVSATSGSICSGQSFSIVPSGAGSYNISGGIFNVAPSVTTSYTVTGFSGGCSNTVVITITVSASPTLAVNSATICSGNSVVIVPTGANTYTITGNNYTVSPNANTAYSVTGTGSNGCAASNTIVSTVSVNTTPTLSVNSATICSGNSVVITPTGATSYSITGNNFTVTPTITTSYSVTGTGNGCAAGNTIVSTISVNITPTLTVNSVTICSGNSVVITPTGAASYSITGNNFTVTPNVTASYSVTGTSNGCAAGNTIVSTVSVNITPTLSVNSATICSGNSVVITPTGSASYSISGNNFTVTPGITSSYTVTGSTNGCAGSAVVSTVLVNATPTLIVNSATICSGASVVITPTGASTYSISGGSFTLAPVATTAYSVTGTAANGCISSGAAIASISVNTTPTLTINSGAICPGNVYTFTPGGAGSYTITGNSFTVNPSVTTSYSLTGTGANGCAAGNTAVSTVTVANTLSLSVTGFTNVCSGKSTTLTASGASTYSWSNGALTNTVSLSPTANTTYTLYGSSGSCSNSSIISLSVLATPTVSINSAAICSGNSATLLPTGAGASGTYTINGSSNFTLSPGATTSYSVAGTAANGCISNSVISTVSVNTTPTVSVNSATICSGNSVTLVATGAGTGGTYAITGTPNFTVTPAITTSYSVTGTTTNGCVSSNTAVATVSVNTSPTLSVNSATICSGATVTLIPTGAGAGGSYAITGALNFTVTPNTTTGYSITGTSLAGCAGSNTAIAMVSVKTTPTLSVNSATICSGASVAITPTATGASVFAITGGNYTVTPGATTSYSVTGTGTNGCAAVNTVVSTISVNTTPTVTVNSFTICSGASAIITPTGAASGTYAITGNSFTVTPQTTTSYSVTGTVNGCTSSNALALVSVNITPTITVNNATLCSGDSVVLTPTGTGIGGTYTIAGAPDFTVSPSTTTSYSITGTAANGCISDGVVSTVSVNITPSIAVNSATICSGASVAITPSGAASYSITGNSFTVSPTITTTYSLTGTGANGCDALNTIISTVSVNAAPTLSVSAEAATVCIGETATLSVSGALTYTWSDSQTGANITFTPTATVVYSVSGTDVNGCVNTAQITQNTDVCLGLKTNNPSAPIFNIYPNPNSGLFIIESGKNITITVQNSIGQGVYTEVITADKTSIDLRHLDNGIYFITAKSKDSWHTVKLVKE